MSSKKKIKKKRNIGLRNVQSIVPKNIDLTKINPFNFVENTKNKLENYYTNLKKEKENENNRQKNRENLIKKEKNRDKKNKLKKKD